MKKRKTKIELAGSIDFQVKWREKVAWEYKDKLLQERFCRLLCASLINEGTTTLHGIARIEEVYRVIEIMKVLAPQLNGRTKIPSSSPLQNNLNWKI